MQVNINIEHHNPSVVESTPKYKLDTMAKLDLDQFSRESQSSESLHFENMDS